MGNNSLKTLKENNSRVDIIICITMSIKNRMKIKFDDSKHKFSLNVAHKLLYAITPISTHAHKHNFIQMYTIGFSTFLQQQLCGV